MSEEVSWRERRGGWRISVRRSKREGEGEVLSILSPHLMGSHVSWASEAVSSCLSDSSKVSMYSRTTGVKQFRNS